MAVPCDCDRSLEHVWRIDSGRTDHGVDSEVVRQVGHIKQSLAPFCGLLLPLGAGEPIRDVLD